MRTDGCGGGDCPTDRFGLVDNALIESAGSKRRRSARLARLHDKAGKLSVLDWLVNLF
jgi:hypothetical protein